MEVGRTGGQAGLSAQAELWSLVKARRQVQQQRQEGLQFVERQLSNLLFGQDLTPAQQSDYVRRLAATAGLAAQLGQGVEVPDLAPARVPRELLLWKAGGMAWRTFPVTRRAVAVTPLHRRLQDRMALALKNKLAGAPESARSCIHAVAISLDRGAFTVPWHDQDRVELTGWGMEMLVLQESLRKTPSLPPPPAILLATVAPSKPLAKGPGGTGPTS
jgi:hypothetical protein